MIGLIVLQFLLFIGLVALLRKLMGRHATTATAHLQGLSQDYLRKADEVKQRLEESERQYQEHLTKAQEEAHRLKQQALTEADLARQQTLDQAHEEAERIVQQANQARESMQREMKGSRPYASIAAFPWIESSFSTSTSTGKPWVSHPAFRGPS